MKNISIDTCVFFSMIKQNDFLLANGINALKAKIKLDKLHFESLEEKIKSLFVKDFQIPPIKYSVEELMGYYEDFLSNKIAQCEKAIEKTEYYDEKGNKFDHPVKEKDKEILAEAQKFLESLDKEGKGAKAFEAIREEYKEYKASYNAGRLLLQSIEGEVKLHITSTAYAEVNNHIIGKTNITDPNAKLYTQQQVDELTKNHFTLIQIGDAKIQTLTRTTAELFRKKQDSTTAPMKPDKNSLNRFGDSLIMAESNLAGIPLATLNEKDFIWDKSFKQKYGVRNSRIRKNMISAAKKDSNLTDALPYSLEDIVEGNFHTPELESPAVKIRHIEIDKEKFQDAIEMY